MAMKEKSEIIRDRLLKARKHKSKWPEPEAELILDLHFKVHSYTAHTYHAEATLEIPVPDGDKYFSVTANARTRRGAITTLLSKIENSMWFHYMRLKGVRFRITGAGMERLYRGYL